MTIKEAEQYVFPSDRWWKYGIFAPCYWSWVLTVWVIGNLVEHFRRGNNAIS